MAYSADLRTKVLEAVDAGRGAALDAIAPPGCYNSRRHAGYGNKMLPCFTVP